jgi:hypothetical protein
MAYCASCGRPIPDDQGSSCSMCYGDIAHGHDGYYEQYMRDCEEQEERQNEASDA